MNCTAEAVLHNNRYLLDRQIGQGVFGITYQATDIQSGETVVIKTLADSLREHQDFAWFKQRLQVRAKLLMGCQHPHLVRVRDYFEEAEQPYLVMDYIPGQMLTEIISADQPLPVPQALYYVRQIGAGLSVLHRAGLLHRDIRPENIIRRAGSHQVVLTDFGTACEFTRGMRETHANLVAVGYAPMERYLPDLTCTPASDVYSLAATLYYLLTGNPPVAACLRDRIPLEELRQFQPHLNPGIERAILQGLEVNPAQRPQTIEAWLDALRGNQKSRFQVSIMSNANITNRRSPKKSHSPQGVPVNFLFSFTEKPFLHRQLQRLQLKKPSFGSPKVCPLPQASSVPINSPKPQRKRTKAVRPKFPWQALILTSAIAAFAGTGFGLAVRVNTPKEAGASLLHFEQSFPARNNWPISGTPEEFPTTADSSVSL